MNISRIYLPSIAIFLVFLFATIALAGNTGKLSGVVRDAETKEPLVGVNIVLVGTTLGGSTDANGAYFVNNVPPGVYEVRVSMIGYQAVTYENVRIMVDVTTELNAELSGEVIQLDREVVVTARRPVVQRDRTSTRSIVEGSLIVKELRFQNVNQVLELQAGVTRGVDGALHIRGGRTGGTVYQVDGVPLLNPFTRTVAGDLEVQNVQELQAHLGTFDAEYGNAADGIVSVYTKDGGDQYIGRFGYESPMLNKSPYQKPDWNLDREDVRSLPQAQQEIYKDLIRKPDGTSAYDYVSVLDDPHVTQDYVLINALGTFTGSLSGPVPYVSPLKFFLSGRLRNEDSYLPWGYTLYRSVTAKLTYQISPLLTLRGSYDWSQNISQDYDHAYKYWRWFDSGQDPTRSGSYPIDKAWARRVLFSLRHVLSPSTFYDFSAAWVYDFSSWIVPDRTVIYDHDTGELIFSDYYTRQYVGGNDSNFQYGDVRYWRKTKNAQYLFKGNLESQLDNHNQLRTGFELTLHETSRHRIGMEPRKNLEFFKKRMDRSSIDGIFTSIAHDMPIQAALYVQDKLEFSFMVLKAGIRLDYFNPHDLEYPDVSDVIYTVTSDSGVEYRAKDKEKVPAHLQISPRIGIAHPISDKTSIHFAYGHFFQIPRFYDLYRNDALNDILVNDALVGNPGLRPEKTVTFEIGLQQQIAEDWALNLTAYSKDIENLTSTYYYFVGRDYSIFINADFGRVQGIDVSLDKRFSNLYAGRLTYSLMSAQGNMSDPTEGYSSYREETATLRPNRNYPLDFDQRHKINLTLITRFPENFGPQVFGFYPFEFFSVTGIFTAGSGLPYTPTSRAAEESNIVPEPNSARRPWIYNLDLKISREIPINPFRVTVYCDIDNVFDAINTRYVWTRTGNPWDEGPTSVRPEDRQANPENVYPPRIIRLGFFFEF